LADNDGCTLAFPEFIIDIDDSKEVVLPNVSAPSAAIFDFDERSALTRVQRSVFAPNRLADPAVPLMRSLEVDSTLGVIR
jgi:hypothetical protein